MSIGDGTAISGTGAQATVTSLAYSLSGSASTTAVTTSAATQDSGPVLASAVLTSDSATATPTAFHYGLTTCQASPSQVSSGLCLNQQTDGSLHQQWLNEISAAGQYLADAISAQKACSDLATGISVAVANGPIQDGIGCKVVDAASAAPGSAVWDFKNQTDVSHLWGLVSSGAVYSYTATTNGSTNTVVPNDESVSVIDTLISDLAGNGYIFPGQALEVTKSPSYSVDTVTTNVDLFESTVWNGMDLLVGQVLDALNAEASSVWDQLGTVDSCANLKLSSSVGCLYSVIEAAVSAAAHAAELAGLHERAAALDTLSKWFLAFDAAELVYDMGQVLNFSGHAPTNVTLTDFPKLGHHRREACRAGGQQSGGQRPRQVAEGVAVSGADHAGVRVVGVVSLVGDLDRLAFYAAQHRTRRSSSGPLLDLSLRGTHPVSRDLRAPAS